MRSISFHWCRSDKYFMEIVCPQSPVFYLPLNWCDSRRATRNDLNMRNSYTSIRSINWKYAGAAARWCSLFSEGLCIMHYALCLMVLCSVGCTVSKVRLQMSDGRSRSLEGRWSHVGTDWREKCGEDRQVKL